MTSMTSTTSFAQRKTGDISHFLRTTWTLLSFVPGGKIVFSKLIGRLAPYTGHMNARVQNLSAGRCVVVLRYSRRLAPESYAQSLYAGSASSFSGKSVMRLAVTKRLSNHLGSGHAAMLVTAMLEGASQLIDGELLGKGYPHPLLERFTITYDKKARGVVSIETSVDSGVGLFQDVYKCRLSDQSGDTVAVGSSTWSVERRRRALTAQDFPNEPVHPSAVMNLMEAATGLALNFGLSGGVRSILREFRIQYRGGSVWGTLHADCNCRAELQRLKDCFGDSDTCNVEIPGVVRDSRGNIVAEGVAVWSLRKG